MKKPQSENNQDPSSNKNSEIKTRLAIQKLLEKNMRQAIGLFHSKELNERGFVNDLFKNFNITPKTV